MKKVISIYFFLLFQVGCFSQQSLGALPKLNISIPLPNKVKLSTSLANREIFYTKDKQEFQFESILTDFTTMLSTKVQVNKTIYLGHLLRRQDGKWVNRLIQRFAWVQSLENARLGHRLGIDQTFSDEQKTIFRSRYRLVLEKPLSGEKVNPKEFYIKLGNEYLLAFEPESPAFEIRLLSNFGYEINTANKLELGLDSRWSDFAKNPPKNKLWLTITWYATIRATKKKS